MGPAELRRFPARGLRRRAPIMTLGCAPENHHLPLRSAFTGHAAPLAPALRFETPDPEIGSWLWSVTSPRFRAPPATSSAGVRLAPFGAFPGLPHPAPSALELSQLLDGLRLRRLACLLSCRRRPWGFESQAFLCPTGLASEDCGAWPPRAQWQCSRSSTAMPGYRRWSVDRSRTSDQNRLRRRRSGTRQQDRDLRGIRPT